MHATRTTPLLFLITLGALLVASAARAQTSQTVTVSSTVPQVLSLAIDANTLSIPFLSSDYSSSTGAATKTVTSGNTLSITSNKSWTVSVKANAAAFSFTPSAGDADPSKTAGAFSYRLNGGTTFTAITTTNASLKTGSKGGTSTTGNSFAVDYQLTSNLSQDPPGTYSLGVVYTLTAP